MFDISVIGFPLVILIIVMVGLYKALVKKKNIQAYYTPFNEITGQNHTEYHEEQKVIIVDDAQGDHNSKRKKPLPK